jgi:hypothetical protein
MAENTNNEELKHRLLNELREAREEINIETHQLRQHLSPVRVLHRLLSRHSILAASIAFTVGVIPAWLVFRGKQTPSLQHALVLFDAVKPPTPSMLGAVGEMAKSITPLLIKSALMPYVTDYLSKKGTKESRGVHRFESKSEPPFKTVRQ